MNMRKFSKEILANQFERTENGQLFLPRSKVFIGGVFEVEHRKNDGSIEKSRDPNLVVNEGLDLTLKLLFRNATPVNPWYMGLFEGNYVPLATDTAATFPGAATETTAYAEGVRQTYTVVDPVAEAITNAASKAVFTFTATKTIYGAFLASASAIGATTGSLLSASRFAVSKSLDSGEDLSITYIFTAADA